MDIPNNDDGNLKYRAALVSIGLTYEDYAGPLTAEMIESAKHIIKEREARKQQPIETDT
jgi:hypothetical protein